MAFSSFEEIEAWQEARKLMRSIRKFCKRAIGEKDFGWVHQITESGLSIMANIAEGNDATTNPEFIQFLGYAKRSSAETRSHFYYGLDEGYIQKNEFNEACSSTKKIGAQLAKLMQYLSKHAKPNRLG